MALPAFTMRQLLEAGVHFGHNTRRWNPKMAPYLFGVRNGIHIIDLQQTVPLIHQAMVAVRAVVAAGGRVLFVGTKRQASDKVADAGKRCGQYYVNHRWLGGMLTNWRTISNSIKRLRELDERLAGETVGLTKKELLGLERERRKLERALGGIKEMGGLPDILIVIDTNKEAIAVAEANKLGIPVVGIIDSNSEPVGIDYPVPGNDDAIRAIDLYCDLMAGAVLDGIQQEIASAGGDLGESPEAPIEALPRRQGPRKGPRERGRGGDAGKLTAVTPVDKPETRDKQLESTARDKKLEPAAAKKAKPREPSKDKPEQRGGEATRKKGSGAVVAKNTETQKEKA